MGRAPVLSLPCGRGTLPLEPSGSGMRSLRQRFPLHEDIGTLHAPATDSLHPQVSTHEYLKMALPCEPEALAGAQSRLPPVHPLRGPGGHRPGAACRPPNLSSSPRSPLVSSVVIPWGSVFPGPSPGHLIPILEVPVVFCLDFLGSQEPKPQAWGPSTITAQQLLCTPQSTPNTHPHPYPRSPRRAAGPDRLGPREPGISAKALILPGPSGLASGL